MPKDSDGARDTELLSGYYVVYSTERVLARGSPRKPVEDLGDTDGQGKFLEEKLGP